MIETLFGYIFLSIIILQWIIVITLFLLGKGIKFKVEFVMLFIPFVWLFYLYLFIEERWKKLL